MLDLKIRLEVTFVLTKDQKVCAPAVGSSQYLTLHQTNIRKTASDIIYQANRTRFVTMNVDVMVRLLSFC